MRWNALLTSLLKYMRKDFRSRPDLVTYEISVMLSTVSLANARMPLDGQNAPLGLKIQSFR